MAVSDKEFESWLKAPSRHFSSPGSVLEEEGLSTSQKREILESWKVDEEELSTATEENMPGDNDNRLQEVVEALSELDEQ